MNQNPYRQDRVRPSLKNIKNIVFAIWASARNSLPRFIAPLFYRYIYPRFLGTTAPTLFIINRLVGNAQTTF